MDHFNPLPATTAHANVRNVVGPVPCVALVVEGCRAAALFDVGSMRGRAPGDEYVFAAVVGEW
ncbi:MAG: hypothetical protein M3143_12000, partial [Actinomycetota bacterium]|nr:hypothetical protein [Actinomycetota bacterium]